MEMRSESGIKISQSVEIDFNNPEQSFLYPRLLRLINWLKKTKFKNVKVILTFVPGIYLFSELTHDARNLGVFNLKYVDSLVELHRDEKVNWSKRAAVIDKLWLRPVPDEQIDYFHQQSDYDEFEFKYIADSFLQYVSEQSSLKILINESYGLISSIGESEEEFKRTCNEYALLEKAEEALELERSFYRDIVQATEGMRHAVKLASKSQQELLISQIENFEAGCKLLLNKAINLLGVDQQNDETISSYGNYSDTLTAEADRISSSVEIKKNEFDRFTLNLTEAFSEVEKDAAARAMSIRSVEVPPSMCTLELLRVTKVWLPYWKTRYTVAEEIKEELVRAY